MLDYLNYKLRMLEKRDLETVLAWRNLDRIRMNMYTDHLITMEEHQAWFKGLKGSNKNITLLFEFMDEPIGVMSYNEMDHQNNNCKWGFYLGKENLQKGTGMVLGYMGLRYAFEILNVRKLSGEVFDFNIASYKFHKKLNFIEEGRLLKHIFKQNKYRDVVLFAQFKEDWDQNKEYLEKELQRKFGEI